MLKVFASRPCGIPKGFLFLGCCYLVTVALVPGGALVPANGAHLRVLPEPHVLPQRQQPAARTPYMSAGGTALTTVHDGEYRYMSTSLGATRIGLAMKFLWMLERGYPRLR